jgi:hypothetical protein
MKEPVCQRVDFQPGDGVHPGSGLRR